MPGRQRVAGFFQESENAHIGVMVMNTLWFGIRCGIYDLRDVIKTRYG